MAVLGILISQYSVVEVLANHDIRDIEQSRFDLYEDDGVSYVMVVGETAKRGALAIDNRGGHPPLGWKAKRQQLEGTAG